LTTINGGLGQQGAHASRQFIYSRYGEVRRLADFPGPGR
jgi:hypothetical protein